MFENDEHFKKKMHGVSQQPFEKDEGEIWLVSIFLGRCFDAQYAHKQDAVLLGSVTHSEGSFAKKGE